MKKRDTRILLVDDEPDIREFIERVGDDAQRIVARGICDDVVSDDVCVCSRYSGVNTYCAAKVSVKRILNYFVVGYACC